MVVSEYWMSTPPSSPTSHVVHEPQIDDVHAELGVDHVLQRLQNGVARLRSVARAVNSDLFVHTSILTRLGLS